MSSNHWSIAIKGNFNTVIDGSIGAVPAPGGTAIIKRSPVTASAFRGLVSAAALLAVLAFAQPSRASVVHRTVNEVITGSGTATFDVNGDGVGDFTITQYFSYNLRGGG